MNNDVRKKCKFDFVKGEQWLDLVNGPGESMKKGKTKVGLG